MRVPAFVVLSLLAAPAASAQLGRSAGPPVTRPTIPPLVSPRPAPPPTWRDLRDIRERIEDGRDEGSLSRRDARRLRREAGQVGVLTERYEVGGVSDAEARELDARTRVLRDQVGVRRTQGAGRSRSR